jgi:hypothetical protein
LFVELVELSLEFADVVLVALDEGSLLRLQQTVHLPLQVVAEAVQLRKRTHYFQEGLLDSTWDTL